MKGNIINDALFQRVTFSVPGRSKEISRTMSKLKRGQIDAESEDIWRNVAFPIPLVAPPSRLPYCSVIDVEYFLQARTTSKSILTQ